MQKKYNFCLLAVLATVHVSSMAYTGEDQTIEINNDPKKLIIPFVVFASYKKDAVEKTISKIKHIAQVLREKIDKTMNNDLNFLN